MVWLYRRLDESICGWCFSFVLAGTLVANLLACNTPRAADASLRYVNSALSLEEIQQRSCVDFVKTDNCLLRLRAYKADEATLAATVETLRFAYQEESSSEMRRLEALQLPTDIRETKCIYLYTDMYFLEMNAALRGDKVLWREYKEEIYAAASGLNKLVDKRFSGLVYRTEVTVDANVDRLLNTYKPGNIVLEASFMSTSKKADLDFNKIRIGYAQILYTVTSKAGVSMDSIAQHFLEAEVLFVPGSTFKVISLEKKVVPRRHVKEDGTDETVEGTQLLIALEELEVP